MRAWIIFRITPRSETIAILWHFWTGECQWLAFSTTSIKNIQVAGTFKTNLSWMVLLPCKSDLTMSCGMSVADQVVIGTDVPDPLDAGLEKFVYMSIVRTASDVLKRSVSSAPFTVRFSHKAAKRLWDWVLKYKKQQIRRLGINVTNVGIEKKEIRRCLGWNFGLLKFFPKLVVICVCLFVLINCSLFFLKIKIRIIYLV